jgi:iron complex transport system permease protein
MLSIASGVTEKASLDYQNLMARRLIYLLIILFVLVVVALFDVLIGPSFLPFSEVLSVFTGPDASVSLTTRVIVHEIRMPMTLMSIIVGASLGIAGLQMQTILGNPLASPYTLGFSAAAGFGAAACILFGFQLPFLEHLTIPVVAFLSAGLACAMVYGFACIKGNTAEVMILAGIATLFLFQSLQSLVQYMAAPEVLQEIVFWLFGSMLKASWFSVSVSGSILVFSVILILPDLWKLTALRLGDDRAQSLGVNVRLTRFKIFAIVSLLTAGAVSFVGTIGFVGLVAPHMARMLVGEDQRLLLPASAGMGALVMVGASMGSKLINPGAVIPIGIVTAVIGVPFLFILLLKSNRSFW